MDVKIETRKPVRVAFMRHTGPYHEVGGTWQAMMGWVAKKGLFMKGPVQMFGLCHDDLDVTPPEKLRYDACVAVGPEVQAEGDVGIQDVAGGEFATTVHVGSYAKLGDTYAAMMEKWMPTSGRKMGPAPSIEEYLNDPRSTPEAELRTRIWLRLGS